MTAARGWTRQVRLEMVVWLETAWSRRHGQRDSRGSIGEEWQAWHGLFPNGWFRIVYARQAARGRVRVRQLATWHFTAGMVPQASALSGGLF